MKRIVAILGIILILGFAAQSFAGTPSILSGEKTASALIYTVVPGTTCVIRTIKVVTDGTNNAKVIVYDSLTATGKVIDETQVIGSNHWGGRAWIDGGIISTGIYVDVSGTGASYFVEYYLGE